MGKMEHTFMSREERRIRAEVIETTTIIMIIFFALVMFVIMGSWALDAIQGQGNLNIEPQTEMEEINKNTH